jgi:2-methylcitrate dehydratase PrpD
MTKPFHAGRAAAAGIEAVRLAEAGMTAAPDALEHPAGFLAALSPNGRADLKSPANTLGRTLRLLERGLSFKKYPMCYGTHRVIDAVLDLARREDISAERVRKANATIGVAQVSMLRNHAPVTGLEAKFSLEFAIASALVARRVGLAELTDEFVNRPAVRDAMAKVAIRTTDTLCPIEPPFAYSDRVELELDDGRKLDSGEVRFARGHAKLPLKDEELEAKFRDCCRGANHIDAGRLFGALLALDSQPRLDRLAA